MMTPLIRDLNARNNPDLMVALADITNYGAKLYAEGIAETNTELHAGEGETSKMLAIAPETVHMDKAEDFIPTVPRPYLSYGSIFRATPTGVWGEPTKASAEKGERMLERMSEICVEEVEKSLRLYVQKRKI